MRALLPSLCVLCGQPAGAGNLCSPCRADLPRPGHACLACALPLPAGRDRLCGKCLQRKPAWDDAVAALEYRYPVDRLVCSYKFNRSFPCGRVLAAELVAALRGRGPPWPELLAPVPLHRRRLWSRTFNQADLLARDIGRALRIPVRNRLLVRARHTPAQSGLSAAGRRRNIRGAFLLPAEGRRWIEGAHLALVDDVLTTGATLAECARTLRRAGAARITIWVSARAPAG